MYGVDAAGGAGTRCAGDNNSALAGSRDSGGGQADGLTCEHQFVTPHRPTFCNLTGISADKFQTAASLKMRYLQGLIMRCQPLSLSWATCETFVSLPRLDDAPPPLALPFHTPTCSRGHTNICRGDIEAERAKLGIDKVIGCSDREYQPWAALDSPSSLWRLFMYQVAPAELPLPSQKHVVFVGSTGSVSQ